MKNKINNYRHSKLELVLHVVELKNQKGEIFYDKLKFVYIELPKFVKKEEEINSHFDKWLYVFTHLSKLQDRPKQLQDRIFTKLFESAEIAKFSPKEREAYEESLKYYRDLKNVVDTSREEGVEESLYNQQDLQKKRSKIYNRSSTPLLIFLEN